MRNLHRVYLIAASILLFFALLVYGTYPRTAQTVFGGTKRNFTLIVDAGHGGFDGGAVSVRGNREADINLAIARKTELLAAFLGLPVKMVRSEDISVFDENCTTIREKKNSDLKNRVRYINETPDALLLSIHQNHFPEEKYSGAQVFYAPTEESKQIAEQMQNSFRNHLDKRNHRKIKPAEKVYLMQNIHCTGVLAECGFLSNPEEELLLRDESYQKKIALSMLEPICAYRNGAEIYEI